MTVYLPDERHYVPVTLMNEKPWKTIGRVVQPGGGGGTGTLVGPRLVLTASHVVPWDQVDGTSVAPGALQFLPASYTDAPAFWKAAIPDWLDYVPTPMTTNVVRAYSYVQIEADKFLKKFPWPFSSVAYDQAVLVLDTDLEASHGFLGVKAFQDGWAGNSSADRKWWNVGYDGTSPLGVQAPLYSGPREVEHVVWAPVGLSSWDNFFDPDTWDTKWNMVLATHIDVKKGHSGGPLLGYFNEDEEPFVVGTMAFFSGTDGDEVLDEWNKAGWNYFAGGPATAQLVAFARGEEQMLQSQVTNVDNAEEAILEAIALARAAAEAAAARGEEASGAALAEFLAKNAQFFMKLEEARNTRPARRP